MSILSKLKEKASNNQEIIGGLQQILDIFGVQQARPLLDKRIRKQAVVTSLIQEVEDCGETTGASLLEQLFQKWQQEIKDQVSLGQRGLQSVLVEYTPKIDLLNKLCKDTVNIKQMTCHVFALSGDTWTAKQVNDEFCNILLGQGEKYGFANELFLKSGSQALRRAREESMVLIKSIRDKQQDSGVPAKVFLCGGFSENKVSPEHMWIEDVTNGKTYDTWHKRRVVKKDRVGIEGRPYQPGCESSPFGADEIVRVPVNGYTVAQLKAIREQGIEPYALSVNRLPRQIQRTSGTSVAVHRGM